MHRVINWIRGLCALEKFKVSADHACEEQQAGDDNDESLGLFCLEFAPTEAEGQKTAAPIAGRPLAGVSSEQFAPNFRRDRTGKFAMPGVYLRFIWTN